MVVSIVRAVRAACQAKRQGVTTALCQAYMNA
jgi:hypothetical protein